MQVSKVAKMLEKRGYEVRVQPIIQTDAGIRKPNILAIIPGVSATVMDVTIITDSLDLRTSHELKRQYYDTQSIHEYASRHAGCADSEVEFSSVTFNWLGALCKQSAKALLGLGLSKNNLKLLSISIVERGYQTWQYTRKATVRYRESSTDIVASRTLSKRCHRANQDQDVVLGRPAHSHLGSEWMFSPIVSL